MPDVGNTYRRSFKLHLDKIFCLKVLGLAQQESQHRAVICSLLHSQWNERENWKNKKVENKS